MRKTGQSYLLRFAAVAVFLAVCAYAAAWLVNGLGGGVRKATVHGCEITESAAIEGVAVRTEEPLTVPAGIADGARVPAGADGFARPAVCFLQTDGYEYLTPDMLDGLTVESLRDILAAEPEKSLSGGRAVYGFAWYFAALADDGAPLHEGGSCEILFDGFEKSTAAEIISVSAAENGQRGAASAADGEFARISEPAPKRRGDNLFPIQRSGAAAGSRAYRRREEQFRLYLHCGDRQIAGCGYNIYR